MSQDRSRSLTRREFDTVIRRAAELATSDSEASEGALTEQELFRIAGEVGLDPTHVRRALSEVRAGQTERGVLDRFFGHPVVRTSRVVPGSTEELAARVDDFLVASQLLQPVRRTRTLLQYRPALDWASQLARAASLRSKKYYIASARSVEVRLEPVERGRSFVEFVVDPGTRGDDIGGAVVGGLVGGGGAGALAAWGLAALIPPVAAVTAGAALAAGLFGSIGYAVGQSHKRKLVEVRAEVEGVLDVLESGASLEPPPPSWRRWVQRHFHGVARDFMKWEDEPGL